MQVEKVLYKGHEIVIEHDENPVSPREDDNICIIHIAHNDFAFGDENYSSVEDIYDAKELALSEGDICLDIYMYHHSGITISLTPFSCRWDSGQVGFIQIPRQKMLKEFGKRTFSRSLKDKGRNLAAGEIENLDSYLRGEIYTYSVADESCGGYYSIEDALSEAKSTVDWIVKNEQKRHCMQVKKWIKNKVPLDYRIYC